MGLVTSQVAAASVLHAFASVAGAANGTTVETDLSTYTLPAGTLAVDGKTLRITAWGDLANNANSKTVKLYFGATIIATPANASANTGNWSVIVSYVMRAGAATQVAYARTQINNGTTETGNSNFMTAPTETLSGAIVIKVTGQSGTASGDVLLQGFIIELLN